MKIISKKDEFRILKLLAKIWVLSEGNHSIQNFGQITESIAGGNVPFGYQIKGD